MKWVELSIKQIPNVMKEIDRISAIYIRKLNEIRNCKASNDEKEDFLKLRQSIIRRVEELDNFYENNFREDKIFFFEQAKLKLKQLLSYDLHVLLNNEELPYVDFEENESISNQKGVNDPTNIKNRFPNKKSISKDMTTKRISVLISSNPLEEKIFQFGETNSQDFQESIPNNEQLVTEQTTVKLENKENYFLEEIYKEYKTHIIFDEDIYQYINTNFNKTISTEKGNLVFLIKLTQTEIESIKKAKECICK